MKVDLPINANLPVDYLPGERLRLEAYRALAAAASDQAVDEVRAELVDRYGAIPAPVENPLMAELDALAAALKSKSAESPFARPML